MNYQVKYLLVVYTLVGFGILFGVIAVVLYLVPSDKQKIPLHSVAQILSTILRESVLVFSIRFSTVFTVYGPELDT
jgi:hypothetical protein